MSTHEEQRINTEGGQRTESLEEKYQKRRDPEEVLLVPEGIGVTEVTEQKDRG